MQAYKIDKKDVEVFRTVSFMHRFPQRHDVMKEKLAKEYANKKDQLDVGLTYALFLMLPSAEDDTLMQKIAVDTSIDVFDHLLRKHPKHWLSMVYKLRLQLSLMNPAFDLELSEEQFQELIHGQNSTNFEAYYVIPYFMAAEYFLYENDMESVERYLDKADELAVKPIVELYDYLEKQLTTLVDKLYFNDEIRLAKKAETIAARYLS